MSDLTEFLLARMTEERMREFTCSWCDASPGLPCRTGHGRVIAAAHSYRRKAAINSGRLPILGQDEDDEYLAIVERQRAEALATIERVKALAEAWRYKGEYGWGAWQEGEGPDQEGYILDGAAGDLRDALEHPADTATVRGQADAEMEEG